MAETDFGYERVAEGEKRSRVAGVFDRVAPRYDLMNDLMSLGLHRLWKAFAVRVARVRPGERVLDIASGSGDLARAFARRAGAAGEVWATDINRSMLARGRDRLLDAGCRLPAVQCDAERLPFPGGYFDCVSVAFGLRNMTHKDAALAEMARVLRPGGRIVVVTLDAHEHPETTAPYGHVHAGFKPAALRRLLGRAGLEVERCEVTSRERREPHFRVVTACARRPAAARAA